MSSPAILAHGFRLFPRVARRAFPAYLLLAAAIAAGRLTSSPLLRLAALCSAVILAACTAVVVTLIAAEQWLGRDSCLRSAIARLDRRRVFGLLMLLLWFAPWFALPAALPEAIPSFDPQGMRAVGVVLALAYIVPRIVSAQILLLRDTPHLTEAVARSERLMRQGGLRGLENSARLATLLAAMLVLGIGTGFLARGMGELGRQYQAQHYLWLFGLITFAGIVLEQMVTALQYTWYIGFYYDLEARYGEDCPGSSEGPAEMPDCRPASSHSSA